MIYSGRVVHLERLVLESYDKKIVTRELIRHGGAAVMVPVLPGEKFVLVYQHRIATDGWLLEFPAGTLEPKEKPRVCAARELIEETGYRAKRLVKLADFLPAPGISTERMHLFLATQLVPAKCNLDHDEFLEVRIVSYSDLARLIRDGKIKDGKTIIGFYYYQEYRKNHRLDL